MIAALLGRDCSIVARYAFIPAEFMPIRCVISIRWSSYAGLHFGALHLAVNGFGLLAFGSGVEKCLGRWRMIGRSYCCGTIGGVLGHLVCCLLKVTCRWAVSRRASVPCSALCCIVADGGNGRNAITASIVFLVTNIVVGMMGVPDQPGLAIAWQAHIAGFITGMLVTLIHYRAKGHTHAAE
jgi:membrane associated rhomboid family serine protease